CCALRRWKWFARRRDAAARRSSAPGPRSAAHHAVVAPSDVRAQHPQFAGVQRGDGHGDALVYAGDGKVRPGDLDAAGVLQRAPEVIAPRPVCALGIGERLKAPIGDAGARSRDDVLADLTAFTVEQEAALDAGQI